LEKSIKSLIFATFQKHVNKMSVIQTIRNKYLGVLIGAMVLALVGFLAMDAVQSNSTSFFQKDRSLGSVNDTKLNSVEYNAMETEYLENAKAKEGKLSEDKINQTKDQAWTDYITEKLMQGEYEKLGLTVTDKELQDMLTGPYPDPYIQQLFSDQKTGTFNPQSVKDYLTQQLPQSKEPADRERWNKVEAQLIKQRLAQKYSSMLSAGLYTPKAQIENIVGERTSVSSINYVKIAYDTTISNVKVTDEEIFAYMNKYKTNFTLQDEMRRCEYVSFDIIPTTADTSLSLGKILELQNEFATSTNIGDVIVKGDGVIDNNYYVKGTAATPAMDSAISKSVGTVLGPIYEDGAYKLIRVMGKKNVPDSARASVIIIGVNENVKAETAEAKIDSLKEQVKKGYDFGALAKAFSDDKSNSDKGGDMGFVSAGSLPDGFRDSVFYGKVGDISKIDLPQGFALVKVTDQKMFKEASKLAVLSKTLAPSELTINTANNAANKFASAAKDKASFDAEVKKGNLTKRVAENIFENQRAVQGIEGSARELIRWVFENKKGAISTVINLPTKCIVANLTEVYEKGLAPAALARPSVEKEIIRQKKAKALIEKYKGINSLEAIASKAGTTIQTADTIILAGGANNVFGNEAKVVGASFNKANVGKVSSAIEGNDGIYFVNVKKIDTPPSTSISADQIEQTRMMLQNQTMQNLNNRLGELLKKKNKVVDGRSNFM
jgi:peptidyl-prolyl cis-trans isomerase D